MRLRSRTPAVALVLLLCAVLGNVAHASKSVLFLFDEDNDLPGLSIINRSVREAIQNGAGRDVEFYSESLNLSQFTGSDDHEAVMLDHFRRKYADKRPDLIVAVLSPALDFLLRHREALFPTVPIVFCGVDSAEFTPDMRKTDVTGVMLRRMYAPTVDIALSLHPNTRNLYVVGGSSVFDLKVQAIARHDLASLESRVRITYLSTLAMPDLLKTVSSLPPDSVLLYLTIFTDGAGRAFIPHNALTLVAQAANAPTYVAVDQYVGLGAVGGHVYSTAIHGRHAGQVSARILNGESARDIPIVEAVDHTNFFDWRQIKRWGIEEGSLPPASVVAFRSPSVWALYKWYIVAGVTLILVQSALIVGLLVSRAQRRRAQNAARESESRRRQVENELRQQRDDLAHALRVTALGELAASFAHELGQPLTAIMANAQAARRFRQASAPGPDIDDALSDIAEGARQAAETIERLRRLSRKEHGERGQIDLNELVSEILRLLRTDLIQKGMEVRLTRGEGLPAVYGDPVQLRQVILNLVVNAEDAIACVEGGPREIDIRTRLTETGLVAVTVCDSGVGADESELDRMFEHFVTTKPHGLGMGLAISRSIVIAHGGRIWASRNEERGLTLHIELPPSTAQAVPG